MLIKVKTKQDNDNNVIDIVRQIVKRVIIAILAGIQRLLSPPPPFDSRFQVFLVPLHFRVVGLVNDVLPTLLGEIYQITVPVLNCPAFTGAIH
jgi:hypothetical protein